MPMTPLPVLVVAAMTLTPLSPSQQARLAAWLNWGAAYRDCYVPAPFSLRIDETFATHCIEETLRGQRGDSPEQQAATDALIAATPQLVALLNASAAAKNEAVKSAARKAPSLEPPASPASR
jgi:hypothetical protein